MHIKVKLSQHSLSFLTHNTANVKHGITTNKEANMHKHTVETIMKPKRSGHRRRKSAVRCNSLDTQSASAPSGNTTWPFSFSKKAKKLNKSQTAARRPSGMLCRPLWTAASPPYLTEPATITLNRMSTHTSFRPPPRPTPFPKVN